MQHSKIFDVNSVSFSCLKHLIETRRLVTSQVMNRIMINNDGVDILQDFVSGVGSSVTSVK